MCVHDVVCDVVDDGASGGEGCSKVGARKHGCMGDGVCVMLCDLVWWNDCRLEAWLCGCWCVCV